MNVTCFIIAVSFEQVTLFYPAIWQKWWKQVNSPSTWTNVVPAFSPCDIVLRSLGLQLNQSVEQKYHRSGIEKVCTRQPQHFLEQAVHMCTWWGAERSVRGEMNHILTRPVLEHRDCRAAYLRCTNFNLKFILFYVHLVFWFNRDVKFRQNWGRKKHMGSFRDQPNRLQHPCDLNIHPRPTIFLHIEPVFDSSSVRLHTDFVWSFRCFRVQGVRKLQEFTFSRLVQPLCNPVPINILLMK